MASEAAGRIILENSGTSRQHSVEKKATGRDLLTTVDPLCEKAIRETIVEAFPHHGFLGEEEIAPGIEASVAALEERLAVPGWLWIVDPIDGTTNFSSGVPLNMPSVAAAYDGVVVAAVLNDPHSGESYTAARGRGAFRNGEPLRVDADDDVSLGDAVVGLESPAGDGAMRQALRGFGALAPRVRTVRLLGSTAVCLPWVAAGRLTAYWTPDECAWDLAAGVLLVTEAGGRVTDVEGREYGLRTRNVVASRGGRVHDELLRVLREEARIAPLV